MEGQGTNLAIKRTGSLSSPGIMYPQGRHPVSTSLCLFLLSDSFSVCLSTLSLCRFYIPHISPVTYVPLSLHISLLQLSCCFPLLTSSVIVKSQVFFLVFIFCHSVSSFFACLCCPCCLVIGTVL